MNMDEVKSQIESVTRSYMELDRKISDSGGAQNLFGMSRKIRQSLEAITLGELDKLLSEIHRAKEGLARLQEDVVELRVLKEVLSSRGDVRAGLKLALRSGAFLVQPAAHRAQRSDLGCETILKGHDLIRVGGNSGPRSDDPGQVQRV
jgi:hypothetical protein